MVPPCDSHAAGRVERARDADVAALRRSAATMARLGAIGAGDSPAFLAADVEFVVETYEPRVQLSDSDLKALTAQAGDFELRASIDNIT